jgi:hypothetical protein
MDRRFTSQDCIGEWRNNFRGNISFNFYLENGERLPVQASPGAAPVVFEPNATQAHHGEMNPSSDRKQY